ncbi:hypothetical protein N7468_000808 [Penicillium chermesinum]|uniref:Uncharacterized protein n=1 Tax=Penicillium chermesinum TaxID=63820 RepID=A0A9W9PFL6_9EURO|nr:uncharacterized protein N7468_000808 [Penicillium chermesinum]KAJ5245825.1 hypothetical protein N7468_000808 [Penicillium chermesinum]KAJ6144124.1 hypothetical protein N7470_008019 [Penicillium chermesinum]
MALEESCADLFVKNIPERAAAFIIDIVEYTALVLSLEIRSDPKGRPFATFKGLIAPAVSLPREVPLVLEILTGGGGALATEKAQLLAEPRVGLSRQRVGVARKG